MSNTNSYHMYIYNLPCATKRTLCDILDINEKWKELAGEYMDFDMTSVNRFGQAVMRKGGSPTEDLLGSWGTKNHTVLELFILLSKMQHYQAMTVLKDLVSPEYRALIYNGEENLSMNMADLRVVHCNENGTSNHAKYGLHNFNHLVHDRELSKKEIFKPEGGCILGNVALQPNRNNDGQDRRSSGTTDESIVGENCGLMVMYSELDQATDNWDKRNLLGKGGFGTVYKGVWKNTPVAIKRLEVQKDGEDFEELWKTHREQSLRELKYLNSRRHDNILPLYGYSIRGHEGSGPYDCLVYQFMPNGSLEDRLLIRDLNKPALTWAQRLRIATGTARGLQFLHTVSTFGDKPLVHGDIKSANILLDSNLEAKIGDFGLAREGPLQQYTYVKISRVHGTRPYLPDEFLRGKKFSYKVDTFSFGIVLFELGTGLRAYDDSRVLKFLKDEVEATDDEHLPKLMDLKAGDDANFTFRKLMTLGKSCIAYLPKDRPDMVHALRNLETEMHSQDTHPTQSARTAGSDHPLPPIPSDEAEDNIPRLSMLGY